jgi:hypothetical protein
MRQERSRHAKKLHSDQQRLTCLYCCRPQSSHKGHRGLRRSRGQVEELILIVSTCALHGFLAPHTECSPGKSVQASLPDFPLAAEANAKGVVPDALQGGLNLAAGRGRPSQVHQSKFSLRGEDTLLEFVRARLNSDSVSATQLLAEFNSLSVRTRANCWV